MKETPRIPGLKRFCFVSDDQRPPLFKNIKAPLFPGALRRIRTAARNGPETGRSSPKMSPGIRHAREMGKTSKSLRIMENFYRKMS